MTDLETWSSTDWMESVSGIKLDPFEAVEVGPEAFAERIEIDDVAHALSHVCRYGGHCRRHYSVAEHTILMADYAERKGYSAKECLTVLHHDNPEYVLGDMVRPVKKRQPEYKALELKVGEAMAYRFNTIWPLPDWLKVFDTRILVDERKAIMNPSPNVWGTDKFEPLGVRFMSIQGRFAFLVKHAWLRRHNKWSFQIAEANW